MTRASADIDQYREIWWAIKDSNGAFAPNRWRENGIVLGTGVCGLYVSRAEAEALLIDGDQGVVKVVVTEDFDPAESHEGAGYGRGRGPIVGPTARDLMVAQECPRCGKPVFASQRRVKENGRVRHAGEVCP